MEYKRLRGTGCRVSRLCLGTMTFGQQADEGESVRMIERAIDGGVNFIDTADGYGKGKSEEIVGKVLKRKRDGIVVASKVCNPMGPDKYRDSGLHRWHVIQGVEASLKRLQVETLDICYMHKPDRETPIEETLAAFDMLVRQGKVLYVGMSNYASWQMMEARLKAEQFHWAKPVVMQVPYNLITRSIEEECVEFSEYEKMGMCVYNPLAGGLLTGKHDLATGPIGGTRFDCNEEYYSRFWQKVNFEVVEQLGRLADDAGISLGELSFRWLTSHPFVDAVIMGVSKIEHLESNLKSIEARDLGEGMLKACDELWQRIRGRHFQYNR